MQGWKERDDVTQRWWKENSLLILVFFGYEKQ